MKYYVKDLELALLSSKVRKSKEALDKFLAEDFFECAQSGKVFTKEDILETLPQLSEERFEIRDYREKIISEGVILVNYIADREVLKTGEKKCTLCSSVWKKEGSNWKMIFFQGTPSVKSHI